MCLFSTLGGCHSLYPRQGGKPNIWKFPEGDTGKAKIPGRYTSREHEAVLGVLILFIGGTV